MTSEIVQNRSFFCARLRSRDVKNRDLKPDGPIESTLLYNFVYEHMPVPHPQKKYLPMKEVDTLKQCFYDCVGLRMHGKCLEQ